MAFINGTLLSQISRNPNYWYFLDAFTELISCSLILAICWLTLVNEAIYGPCIWLIKLALFVLYLEVFGLLQWFRYLVFTGVFVTGAFYFATLVSFVASCRPMNGQSQFSYLSGLAGPRCQRTTRPLVLAIGVVNVVSDLYLLPIPLPPVWSLQLPLRRKIGLSPMILTGLMSDYSYLKGDDINS